MPDRRAAFGKRGEDAACEELQRRGYVILDRRFRTRRGELDIVARHHGVIVFIEVKARTSGRFGSALESITWQKRRRLAHMAASYLSEKNLVGISCRFDVVAILEPADGPPIMDVVQSAFDIGT